MNLCVAALAAAALVAPAAAPPPRPWALPEMLALPAPQQAAVQAVAADEFCGCDSALTLAGCLQTRPGCGLATALQGLLVRAAGTGAPKEALAGFMSTEVLGPLCAPPVALKLDGAPRKGRANAPLTVVEFADFRCSHCRAAMPGVHRALAAYDKKVALVYAPISLQQDPMSTAAAEAAMAAHAQGKFWEMHAALFEREAGDFTAEVIDATARKVGLDLKRFAKEMGEHRYADTVAGYRAAALAAGLEGTPTFFVAGRRFAPTPEIFELEERLRLELLRDQKACK